MSKTTEKLISALESLPEIQQRIDRVAEDFTSGKNTYAEIDASKLANLLGLDLDEEDDSPRCAYAYRRGDIEDAFDRPFEENIYLLDGLVPTSRYAQLEEMAKHIGPQDDDLPLTKQEIALIKEAYVEAQAEEDSEESAAMLLGYKTVTSSAGIDLVFSVCIGDGGEVFDATSPYDSEDFDATIFVEMKRGYD
jgi:hypothetical protein